MPKGGSKGNKNAVGNKGGQPSKYPEVLKKIVVIKKLLIRGVPEEEVSMAAGVSYGAFKNYKKDYPEFFAEIENAKHKAVEQVERSLFKIANGYKFTEIHKDGNRLKTVTKEVPPSLGAQQFYLKNKAPKIWKDKQEIEHSNPDGSLTPDNTFFIIQPTPPKNQPNE